jgi:hypothetical protein
MKWFRHITLLLCLFAWSGLVYGDNLQVSIANLVNGSMIPDCQDFTVKLNVSVENTDIKEVRVYAGTGQVARLTKEPWEAEWKNVVNGYYYPFYARATDDDNNQAFSDTIGVFVGDVEPSNLIFNSNFSCSLFKWSAQWNSSTSGSFTWEEDADISEGGAAYLEITNGSDTDWHVQVYQIFPIDSGHTYEIYFVAETPISKAIQWAMQSNVGPDYTFYNSGPETLEGNNFYGPYEFVAPVTDPNNAFKLFLGGNTVPVYLDDVWIIDRSVTFPEPVVAVEKNPGTQPDDFELFESYPNPFNSNAVIEYEIPVSSEVELTIYNIRGEWIKTLVKKSLPPGRYQIQWDGTRENGLPVSSGPYIAQLTTKTTAKTRIRTLKLTLME